MASGLRYFDDYESGEDHNRKEEFSKKISNILNNIFREVELCA